MDSSGPSYNQNVVILRHGDRRDHFDPQWVKTAERPWDPPLIDAGLIRAFATGRKLRSTLEFPIHRVFVSPFFRCIQTASQVVSALCAIDDDPNTKTSGDVGSVNPSRLKVAIEYGLCEALHREAITPTVAPPDGKFTFNIPELEAMFPEGTVDRTVVPVYKELPKWEETVSGAKTRYEMIFKLLADKYPSENLLLVTHAEGVGVSVTAFSTGATVSEIDYCAYTELRREIINKNGKITAGNFDLLTRSGQTGITFSA